MASQTVENSVKTLYLIAAQLERDRTVATGELAQALRFAVAHLDSPQAGPIVVRYPCGDAQPADWKRESMPFARGKGEILMEGDDVALIAIGSMVAPAFAAGRAQSRSRE